MDNIMISKTSRSGSERRLLPLLFAVCVWASCFLGSIAVEAQSTPQLFVVNNSGNLIRYDGNAGTLVGAESLPSGYGVGVVNAGTVAIGGGVAFGPDGNIYVSASKGGSLSVIRYNGATGAFIDIFVGSQPCANLTCGGSPAGLAFGPDGNLYLADFFNSRIRRYNGTTGTFLGDFVTREQSGGLLHPTGIRFGPDGHLYVLGYLSGLLHRYNGTTGASMGTFANVGSTPLDLAFGKDGHLYVVNFGASSVSRYNGKTGASMGDFLGDADGGLLNPISLTFGPNGNLYVGQSFPGYNILRYNGTNGAFMGAFVPSGSGGLRNPLAMTFAASAQQVPPVSEAVIYPQIGMGGGFKSIVFIVNKRWNTPWQGSLHVVLDNGMRLLGGISLSPRRTLKLDLAKLLAEPLPQASGGYLEINPGLGFSVADIATSLFYNFELNGRLVDSTGVDKGAASKAFSFPVERSSVINTGMAIRRRASDPSANITAILYNQQGQAFQPGKQVPLGARFFDEVFSGVPSDFIGHVLLVSNEKFYLTVLRLETTESGFQLTSVPANPEGFVQ